MKGEEEEILVRNPRTSQSQVGKGRVPEKMPEPHLSKMRTQESSLALTYESTVH